MGVTIFPQHETSCCPQTIGVLLWGLTSLGDGNRLQPLSSDLEGRALGRVFPRMGVLSGAREILFLAYVDATFYASDLGKCQRGSWRARFRLPFFSGWGLLGFGVPCHSWCHKHGPTGSCFNLMKGYISCTTSLRQSSFPLPRSSSPSSRASPPSPVASSPVPGTSLTCPPTNSDSLSLHPSAPALSMSRAAGKG